MREEGELGFSRGRLNERPLASLLIAARSRGATGVLRIQAGGGTSRLFFRDGVPAGALMASGFRPLGHVMVVHGLVDLDTLDRALPELERGKPLADVLLAMGELDEAGVSEALRLQQEDHLQALAALGDGYWEFTEQTLPEWTSRVLLDADRAVLQALAAPSAQGLLDAVLAQLEGRSLRLTPRFDALAPLLQLGDAERGALETLREGARLEGLEARGLSPERARFLAAALTVLGAAEGFEAPVEPPAAESIPPEPPAETPAPELAAVSAAAPEPPAPAAEPAPEPTPAEPAMDATPELAAATAAEPVSAETELGWNAEAPREGEPSAESAEPVAPEGAWSESPPEMSWTAAPEQPAQAQPWDDPQSAAAPDERTPSGPTQTFATPAPQPAQDDGARDRAEAQRLERLREAEERAHQVQHAAAPAPFTPKPFAIAPPPDSEPAVAEESKTESIEIDAAAADLAAAQQDAAQQAAAEPTIELGMEQVASGPSEVGAWVPEPTQPYPVDPPPAESISGEIEIPGWVAEPTQAMDLVADVAVAGSFEIDVRRDFSELEAPAGEPEPAPAQLLQQAAYAPAPEAEGFSFDEPSAAAEPPREPAPPAGFEYDAGAAVPLISDERPPAQDAGSELEPPLESTDELTRKVELPDRISMDEMLATQGFGASGVAEQKVDIASAIEALAGGEETQVALDPQAFAAEQAAAAPEALEPNGQTQAPELSLDWGEAASAAQPAAAQAPRAGGTQEFAADRPEARAAASDAGVESTKPGDDVANEQDKARRQRLLRRAFENLGTLPQPGSAEAPPPPSGGVAEPEAPAAAAPAAGALAPEDAALAKNIEEKAARLPTDDHFARLGVPRSATREQVKNAYLGLVKTFHPDRVPPALAHLAPKVKEIFSAVRDSYELLQEDAKRKAYLEQLTAGGKPGAKASSSSEYEALLKQADLASRKKEFIRAAELFGQAYELAHKAGDLAQQAWSLYLDPNHATPVEQVKRMLEEAVKQDARCDRAVYSLGVIARVEGALDLAEKQFRRAVDINPRHAEAATELRLIQMRRKKPGKKGLFG